MEAQESKLANRTPTQMSERVAQLPQVAPPVDIYESKDEILLVSDFPGVSQSGLVVRLDGAELRIEGTQAASEQTASFTPLHLIRTFEVPDSIDAGATTASLKDGVLTVRLVKSQAAKPKRIAVQAG